MNLNNTLNLSFCLKQASLFLHRNDIEYTSAYVQNNTKHMITQSEKNIGLMLKVMVLIATNVFSRV
jgi:hypothetical protein